MTELARARRDLARAVREVRILERLVAFLERFDSRSRRPLSSAGLAAAAPQRGRATGAFHRSEPRSGETRQRGIGGATPPPSTGTDGAARRDDERLGDIQIGLRGASARRATDLREAQVKPGQDRPPSASHRATSAEDHGRKVSSLGQETARGSRRGGPDHSEETRPSGTSIDRRELIATRLRVLTGGRG